MPAYVDASDPIFTGAYGRPPAMYVEVAPGRIVQLRPGRNELELPCGRRRLRFYSQYWFFQVGRAELDVDARPGQPLWLHYAAPYLIYSRGRAGFGQLGRRPGAAAAAMILGSALLLPLALVGIFLLIRALS